MNGSVARSLITLVLCIFSALIIAPVIADGGNIVMDTTEPIPGPVTPIETIPGPVTPTEPIPGPVTPVETDGPVTAPTTPTPTQTDGPITAPTTRTPNPPGPVPTWTPYPPDPGPYGAIYAQSTPGGAAIYLNGNFRGYSPLTMTSIPPGTYSLRASLNGYTTTTQLVTVLPRQTAVYYPVLQPSPPSPRSTGTVYVTSSPPGAQIYADGSYQGKTPLTVTLFPGSHTIRLTQPGYLDYSTPVTISANTNQNLNARMAAAVYGSVSITSLPGASVFMDSIPQGTIPRNGILTISSIPSGGHQFRISASGFSDWINTVYIQPNVEQPIHAPLTPAGSGQARESSGSIEIISTPAGADLFIDDLLKGYTPITITGIPSGNHRIVLKFSGYVDSATTATVTAGQTTPLAISMQPAPSPTQKSPVSSLTVLGACTAVLVFVIIQRRSSP